MLYGYCRISTPSQSIERQVQNIKNAFPAIEEGRIFQETYTGTKRDGRAKLKKLLSLVKAGDTIVFDSVSRMSRNAAEGVELYKDLFSQGVDLIFLNEPQVNTSVYRDAIERHIEAAATGNNATDKLVSSIIDAINAFMIDLAMEQIRLAFDQAQKEVDDLHKRTSEGMREAKRLDPSKQIGAVAGKKLNVKKAATSKAYIREKCRDFGGPMTDKEVMAITKLARNTYYKYKAEIRAEI